MSGSEGRSRRDLIATVAGGTLLGALWGAAFPIVATERRPTISVVGHHRAQVALLDTSSSRVLLLSGEPDDKLLESLPAIMTMFRQRIDLIVATTSVLSHHAATLGRRWRIRHALALEGRSADIALSLPTSVVEDGIDARLDEHTHLRIRMGHRLEWMSALPGQESPLWCVTMETRAGNVVMVPDIGSFAAIGPPAATLLIAPDAPATELIRISPASAMAVNYDSDTIRTSPSDGPALTRIYPTDVARFVIDDGQLVLPEWTSVFERSTDSD